MLQENEHLGIFHFHSEYSFDSDTKITTIADKIEVLNLEFAVLTDHDDVGGSLALAAEIQERALTVEVPAAAEYKTEIGDIIVVGSSENLKNLPSKLLFSKIKKSGAISVLPHPYDGHKLSEELINKIDVVEVFNGRSSQTNNKKSQKLAAKFKKPTICASDAHLSRHLGHVIIAKPKNMSFKNACLHGKIRTVKKHSLNQSDIFLSQLIKARKQRNFGLLLRVLVSPIIEIIRVKFPNLFEILKMLRHKL